MAICPVCSKMYESDKGCPRCGGGNPHRPLPGPRWLHTAWGRIAIGLVLAQGLFYGLQQLLTGILLFFTLTPEVSPWQDPHQVMLLQGVQLLCVFAGATLAAGGQQSGLLLGLMVGLWNGILSGATNQNPGQGSGLTDLVALTLLQGLFGILGGAVGTFIWKPIPLTVPNLLVPVPRPVPVRTSYHFLEGRIAWVRVLLGTVLAVTGTLSASLLFNKLLDSAKGLLTTTSHLQDQLLIWEIKALAVFIGGALAGASTTNGPKQGLLVGLFASTVLIGIQMPRSTAPLEFSALTFVGTTALALAGGWFGGNLLPPLAKKSRRGISASI
jgi:hypothetical protein